MRGNDNTILKYVGECSIYEFEKDKNGYKTTGSIWRGFNIINKYC